MVPEKSLVSYKKRPALVSAVEGEKITVAVFEGSSVKVREKDIELIHTGPCAIHDIESAAPQGSAREAWELLCADNSPGVSLRELAELVYGIFTPRSAWAAYELLRDELFFSGETRNITARPPAAVEDDIKKREEKQKESGDRAALLEKLKKLPPFRGDAPCQENLSAADHRFLQDVEALARGQTDKSKTLKDLGKAETPEEAHRLLLASKVWTVWENPHPGRFGFNRDSAKIIPAPPPEEERLDLTRMAAYAIDNPWSNDPDDAVSLELSNTGEYILWVHVADPAAAVLPGSPVDMEARGRGATLYLPEGASRMIAPEALSFFALGLTDRSPALSFRIVLTPDINIKEMEIIPSVVKVTRITYAEADELIQGSGHVLQTLAVLMEQNVERRLNTGAVIIDLPDVHIQVSLDKGSGAENSVSVESEGACRSAGMVRECMLLAGEGAAGWALQKQLPFPFISQEAGELPGKRLPGLAGAWQLRRCMRSRNLSVKPGVHWGLGLDAYTQVTSPLRRYTDLVCHQQIRAWLRKGGYEGLEPLSEEEILFRVSAAEASAAAAMRAERASKAHWLAVYLLDKKGSPWNGVVLDRKGSKGTVLIPALGLETQVSLRGNEEPNDEVQLIFSSAKVPEGELSFTLQG